MGGSGGTVKAGQSWASQDSCGVEEIELMVPTVEEVKLKDAVKGCSCLIDRGPETKGFSDPLVSKMGVMFLGGSKFRGDRITTGCCSRVGTFSNLGEVGPKHLLSHQENLDKMLCVPA